MAGEKTELEKTLQECMDAEGYLILVGIRKTTPSANPDKEREEHIDWNYRRFHFGLEDALQAVSKLNKFVEDEIVKMKSERIE